MDPQQLKDLKKAEGIIRSVAQDFKGFGEADYLNDKADAIGQFVEANSN